MLSISKVNVLKVDPGVGITETMVNSLADSYEESGHRAPVVIGHPKDNAPAWGWVKSCEASEGNLYCDLDVTPEFHQLLSEGKFQERSVSFYDSNPPVLRHLGFLGAMPPKIKGLDPIQLSDEGESVSSVNQNIESNASSMEEFLKPVVLYALSETFEGITPKSFKSEPVLNGDSITGVVNLSDGTEYGYTLSKQPNGTWVSETKLNNPEVIELSERVQLLERQLSDTANKAVVDQFYQENKLTEAILPKCDCLKLLSEDTTGMAVKLIGNLPSLVTTDAVVPEADTKPATGSFASFELAENPVYTQVLAKCKELNLDHQNPQDFAKAYNSVIK